MIFTHENIKRLSVRVIKDRVSWLIAIAPWLALNLMKLEPIIMQIYGDLLHLMLVNKRRSTDRPFMV